jgi:membrane protein
MLSCRRMATAKSAPAKSSLSLWRLGGLTSWRLARLVAVQVRANNFFGRASELAFDFLFALFPLILFMLSLFGLFASHSAILQQDLLSYFADFLPPTAFDLLGKTTAELAAHASGGKLTLGIALALWFASGGVASMISALNLTYRIQEGRSWLRVRLIALCLTLAISILLLTALVMALASGSFLDWLGRGIGLPSTALEIWKALQWPEAILFVLLSFSLIYILGPNIGRRRWHWITPGAAFGSIVWLGSSLGFRIYLHFFNTYAATYGSLGAVMILLAWLYLAALAFLIGGQINAEIERASKQQG